MRKKQTGAAIQFNFLQQASLKERTRLKHFLLSLFRKEGTSIQSLSYVFCSDEYLLGINQQFLQHNYYTDIVTFNLAARGEAVEGEIYISVDRVMDNAKTLKEHRYRELHRVIFHGALHLCGYKDKIVKDISIMRAMEEYYLKRYFNN